MLEKESEITRVVEMAKYREIASGAFYTAGQVRTDDPGARALMKDLAEEESRHYQWLSEFKESNETRKQPAGVKDLLQTEYLTGGETLEGAGLQDTLIFAIKREQASIDFYSRMTGVMTTAGGKEICERLAAEELRHKVKLELLYERLFYKEN